METSRSGTIASAIEDLNQLAAIFPNFSPASAQRARLYMKIGQTDIAAPLFESALQQVESVPCLLFLFSLSFECFSLRKETRQSSRLFLFSLPPLSLFLSLLSSFMYHLIFFSFLVQNRADIESLILRTIYIITHDNDPLNRANSVGDLVKVSNYDYYYYFLFQFYLVQLINSASRVCYSIDFFYLNYYFSINISLIFLFFNVTKNIIGCNS